MRSNAAVSEANETNLPAARQAGLMFEVL